MKSIEVTKSTLDDRKIISRLIVPSELKKFVKNLELFIEYDTDIFGSESILNIPLVATVLPLAWLSGTDIHVSSIDKAFKESMDSLQIYFKDIYHNIPFKTKIHADELVDNRIEVTDPSNRTGLLFSGGVDATYSMIKNVELQPRLIMYWGVERTPYPKYSNYWKLVIEKYRQTAKRYGLQFNAVKTNVLEILDHRRIEHYYNDELYYGSLWVRLQESPVLLSLAAPLSVKRFDNLLIAASEWTTSIETLENYRPHVARPEADELIKWADLDVIHDGFIERLTKLKELSGYLDSGGELRVCLNRKDAPTKLNCSHCEKCGRTIVQLVQVGVDPNKCGFSVKDSTPFELMKEYYLETGIDTFALDSKLKILDTLDYGFPGANEYFEWLKNYNVPEKEESFFWRDIYLKLPYQIAKMLNEIYNLVEINIFYGNPKLTKDKISKLYGNYFQQENSEENASNSNLMMPSKQIP